MIGPPPRIIETERGSINTAPPESTRSTVIAGARSTSDLEQVRVRMLGRSGQLTTLLRSLGAIPAAERPKVGEQANRAKAAVEAAIAARLEGLKADEHRQTLAADRPDLTLPGRRPLPGAVHPLTRVTEEIIEVFEGLGFSIAEGPEVESDFYNFAALNFPDDHPARDMQDTFHLSADTLLRTHTSPVQIRTMKAQRPPVRIICLGQGLPARHPRRDPLARCSTRWRGSRSTSTSRWPISRPRCQLFAREMFGPKSAVRFRPSFFPFTEPSAEVDVRCFKCGGDGCRFCKESGWLEILGSGMVHPNVLRNVGYDPEEVTGWAFGMGIDRVALLKYEIDDIRLFFDNDLRFLQQFGGAIASVAPPWRLSCSRLGLDDVDALLGQQGAGRGEQHDRPQQVVRHQRDLHVQLEVALHAADRDRGVVADHLRADLAATSGITGLTLPGMIDEPFCSSGRKISPRPARGPEPIQRRSLEILVSDTATVFSAPDAATRPSRLACASNGSAGGRISRPVSATSRARTRAANSGCVLRPVPVAVPPSGISPRPTTVDRTRRRPSRTWAA